MIFCPRLMTVAHLKSDEMWEGLYKGFFNDPSYDLQEGEVSSSYGTEFVFCLQIHFSNHLPSFFHQRKLFFFCIT